MCGIVAAVAARDVSGVLMEGLRRLEYRGYDSAGVALVNGGVRRVRKLGKVAELQSALDADPCAGNAGVAHTRWATHGAPDEANAHPHISGRIVIVHNGIIENYEALKKTQTERGFDFTSETDTEVIAHQIMWHLSRGGDLLRAVSLALKDLKGTYALGVIDVEQPGHIVLVRNGSPLVIGAGADGGHYAASDVHALLQVTTDFIVLENGDIARIGRDGVRIFNGELEDGELRPVERAPVATPLSPHAIELGEFDHFMQKEIHDQPCAVTDTLEGRLLDDTVPDGILGPGAAALLDAVKAVQIVACGTSYHAGLVARHWFEEFAGVPCRVEIASEFRYRRQVILPGTLFVAISQSGETADTLAALALAKKCDYLPSVAICNVPESSLVRESDRVLMTHAGPEIGVASTKAFTTQLVTLLLLAMLLGKRAGMEPAVRAGLVAQLRNLPSRLEQALALEPRIRELAQQYADKNHVLFLGRGRHYPVAMEGALKMKEISYIHAEAYAAGELKHGLLALVDRGMPVVSVAPNDHLLAKLKSNLQEVRARGGVLHVCAASGAGFRSAGDSVAVIELNAPENAVAPIVFTLPLQILAYHTALLKGTDIDQPRNLAKSVTVE